MVILLLMNDKFTHHNWERLAVYIANSQIY